MRALNWLVLPVLSTVLMACGGSTMDSGSTSAGDPTGKGGQTSSGGQVPANWSCDRLPLDTPYVTAEHSVTLHLRERLSAAPTPGVNAKLCPYMDPDCTVPLDTGVSDADGDLRLTVPQNAPAMVRLEKEGFAPILYGLPVSNTDQALTVETMTLVTWKDFLGKLEQPNLEFGAALLSIIDCDRRPAAGVRLTSMHESFDAFYSVDGLPTRSASETDVNGIAGFLFPSPIGAEIQLSSDGTQVMPTRHVSIERGTLSYVSMIPIW